ELAGELIESARAPEFTRRLGIFEERVAALNNAVRHHAMESAALVESLARERKEVLDVLGRLIRREFDAKRTEIGGDDRFEIVGGLPQRDGHRAEDESEER